MRQPANFSGSMQSPDNVQALVSIVDLKNLARTKLPSSSALRDLILSEPDYLPPEEVRIKVRMYSRLLYRELDRVSP
jgi:hypothetical protein